MFAAMSQCQSLHPDETNGDDGEGADEEVRIIHNNFTLIIDIQFYETFSASNLFKALALHSLDTLSDIRIKAFTLLF
jgi:hypothetical protein